MPCPALEYNKVLSPFILTPQLWEEKKMQFTREISKKRRWQRMRFLKVISNSLLLSEAEISVTSVPFLWQEKTLKIDQSSWLVALIWDASCPCQWVKCRWRVLETGPRECFFRCFQVALIIIIFACSSALFNKAQPNGEFWTLIQQKGTMYLIRNLSNLILA